MQDKFQAAETFFEAAVTFEPQNILAWTMFGALFHVAFLYNVMCRRTGEPTLPSRVRWWIKKK